MKPTAIWITGTRDNNKLESAPTQAWEGTNFTPCAREVATHVSVYLIDETESEPVKDFALGTPKDMAAYAEALTLASQLAHEHKLEIRDTYQKQVFRAPAGAVIATAPPEVREVVVSYFARLLGKSKWESVSKSEFESYQMGSLYETKTEPVCDAATWYAEAMAASNELGYAGMDAASVIRHLGKELAELKKNPVKALEDHWVNENGGYHPAYTVEKWMGAVKNNCTRDGYWVWVQEQINMSGLEL